MPAPPASRLGGGRADVPVRPDVSDNPYDRREGAGSGARGEDAPGEGHQERQCRVLPDRVREPFDEVCWIHGAAGVVERVTSFRFEGVELMPLHLDRCIAYSVEPRP